MAMVSIDSSWNRFHFSSEDLYRCIDEDEAAYPPDSACNEKALVTLNDPFWPPLTDVAKLREFGSHLDRIEYLAKFVTYEGMGHLPYIDGPRFPDISDDELNSPSILGTMMMNPRTGALVTPEEWQLARNSTETESEQPVETFKSLITETKTFNPLLDHDYPKRITEEEDEMEVKAEPDDEPYVDVWGIDNYWGIDTGDEQVPTAHHTSEQLPASRQAVKKETRRTSKRTADMRIREQARKISDAVHAVLNTKKPKITRQYKNIKPKNSVETTPSQSDIEEWHSQPIRPTYSKITKKKTSKGRIDHSESERHRREVLRRNFHSLSELIPADLLRGEKASSQISKQKILNGAKGFIVNTYKVKGSYKAIEQQNEHLRQRLQKLHISKLSKCVKRLK